MNLVDELYAVTAALRDAGIHYAVCGGLAVLADLAKLEGDHDE